MEHTHIVYKEIANHNTEYLFASDYANCMAYLAMQMKLAKFVKVLIVNEDKSEQVVFLSKRIFASVEKGELSHD